MISLGLFFEDGYEMLRKSVEFYTAISQEEISERYDENVIDRIGIRKIKADFLPVIQKGEFIELDKIKNRVKEFLSGLLVLTANEQDIPKLLALLIERDIPVPGNIIDRYIRHGSETDVDEAEKLPFN